SPHQHNVTSYGATTVAIITLQAFAGMWINAVIVCALCIGWVKKKTLNSNEKILLLLGCSRFWHLCFSWVYSFLSIIYPNYFYVQPTCKLLLSIQNFFDCSNFCVSACLCVFYCIKIANFRNSCFVYLKVKIDRIVPWLLLGSLLLSLAISSSLYYIIVKAQSNNHTSSGQGNFSKVSGQMDDFFLHISFIYGFGFVTSFTAVIFSAVFLLFSLWRHKHKMQTNSMNSLSMHAHIKAMKSILSFFIIYSINFLFLTLILILSWEENPMMFLVYVFLYAFPGVHSLILIFSNPKLKNTLIRILSCVKCKVCTR
ncbi:T2R40 protein, partial [Picathartes gymnocephalus]|nr:T2R40 protein [Picathartes gymnocephalus]